MIKKTDDFVAKQTLTIQEPCYVSNSKNLNNHNKFLKDLNLNAYAKYAHACV